MEIGINQLFEMLSSDSPVEIQNRGIEEAENIKYLSIFFQPVEDKGVWENCAKVVSKKTDAVLKDYLIWMFELPSIRRKAPGEVSFGGSRMPIGQVFL